MIARLQQHLFSLLLLLFPTQLGRHFWPQWTQVLGIRVDYLSPTLYLTDVILFFLFLTFLPEVPSFFKKVFEKHRFGLWGGSIVIIFLLVGISISERPIIGFYQLAKWLALAALAFYVVLTLKTKTQRKRMIFLLSWGVIFESLLALAQFFRHGSLGGPFWWLGERTFSSQTPGIAQAILDGELVLRSYGTFSHPNVLAGYLVVVLTLILGTDFSSGRGKATRWLALILGTLALFFTFSRLAWIAGILIIFYWLASKRNWLLVLAIVFFLILGSSFIASRFQTLFTTDWESWQRREELNSAAWAMIKTHPLWGVGLGNFLVELPSYHEDRGAVRFLQPAHNVYFMIAAETGLVGLGFFLGFLFLTFKRLFKKQFFRTLLIAFSAILFLSFFDHYFYTLQQTQLLFSFIFGLSWSSLDKRV